MTTVDKNVYKIFNEEDLKDHQAIAAVIRNSDGLYLMINHKKYNFWTFPIGKVKPEQTVEEALVTEVFEECGIIVSGFREVTSFTKQYDRTVRLVTITTHIFEINNYQGQAFNAEPEKHSELIWLSLSEIKGLTLSDATREYLHTKINNKKIGGIKC